MKLILKCGSATLVVEDATPSLAEDLGRIVCSYDVANNLPPLLKVHEAKAAAPEERKGGTLTKMDKPEAVPPAPPTMKPWPAHKTLGPKG